MTSWPLDESNDDDEISIGLDGLPKIDSSSKLCTTCLKMTLPKLQSARYHDHKHYSALKSSASHCPMCKMMLTGLEKAWAVESQEMDRQGSLDADKEALERKVMVSIEQPFLTGYISRHFKTEILEGKALYYCLAPVKISWPIVQGHLDIQLTPQEDGTLHEADSDGRLERLQKLRQILDEDVIGVANGRVSAESSSSVSSSMPTRVLDLGTSEGDLDDNIRLLETTSFEPSEIVGFRWVALSHRWGTLPQFKTLKANLQKHYERIAFGALPKTFQDAVLVTRGLGLKYL
jgi:hypothetical protein